MDNLIIGAGEIGTALQKIFNCDICDIEGTKKQYDIIHIAIPYSTKFEEIVRKYQDTTKAKYTVIHSTVPVGTSKRLNAIHSPVLGIHPHLEQGIRTFTKFLGGKNASEIADVFRFNGIRVYLFDKSETTELMKILDTTFYGVCLEYTKDVKRLAKQFDVPFEAWTIWTDNYNQGYEKLGHKEFSRPNLTPIMKQLGGHCILPNAKLLETKFTKFLNDCN